MKFLRILAFLALSGAAVPAAAEAPKPDLVLTHGRIYTPTGWSEAVAIKDGVIIQVGSNKDVEAMGAGQVVDLAGKTVIPGFADMHSHATSVGYVQLFGCPIPAGSPQSLVLSRIRECAAKLPKGAWVNANSFDPTQFKDRTKLRTLLDTVSPNNPVLIHATDEHSAWANSLAFKAAGVTAATPNPPGGTIERDSKGEPSGIVSDTGSYLIGAAMPVPTFQQKVEALEWASRTMATYGITSYTEAATGGDDQAVFAAVADKGALLQRARVCTVWSPARGGLPEGGLEAISHRNTYARPMVDTGCVKIFSDGVPTISRTSPMLEPYLPHDGKSDDRGFFQMPVETLAAALTKFDAEGLTIKVHACGDAAVRETLNAYEVMRKANGFTRLHEVAHWCFAKPEDIARARGLGLTMEISAFIFDPADPINKDMKSAVGAERMKHFFPIHAAFESGANVTLGSDWPCKETPDPWPAIETLVTRSTPGAANGPVDAPDERITLAQAIEAYTVNGAKQLGVGAKVGRIETGMLADLAVLDRNPFEIPITDVGKTKVLMTLVGGKVVYRAGDQAH